jgi:hypothetical protein
MDLTLQHDAGKCSLSEHAELLAEARITSLAAIQNFAEMDRIHGRDVALHWQNQHLYAWTRHLDRKWFRVTWSIATFANGDDLTCQLKLSTIQARYKKIFGEVIPRSTLSRYIGDLSDWGVILRTKQVQGEFDRKPKAQRPNKYTLNVGLGIREGELALHDYMAEIEYRDIKKDIQQERQGNYTGPSENIQEAPDGPPGSPGPRSTGTGWDPAWDAGWERDGNGSGPLITSTNVASTSNELASTSTNTMRAQRGASGGGSATSGKTSPGAAPELNKHDRGNAARNMKPDIRDLADELAVEVQDRIVATWPGGRAPSADLASLAKRFRAVVVKSGLPGGQGYHILRRAIGYWRLTVDAKSITSPAAVLSRQASELLRRYLENPETADRVLAADNRVREAQGEQAAWLGELRKMTAAQVSAVAALGTCCRIRVTRDDDGTSATVALAIMDDGVTLGLPADGPAAEVHLSRVADHGLLLLGTDLDHDTAWLADADRLPDLTASWKTIATEPGPDDGPVPADDIAGLIIRDSDEFAMPDGHDPLVWALAIQWHERARGRGKGPRYIYRAIETKIASTHLRGNYGPDLAKGKPGWADTAEGPGWYRCVTDMIARYWKAPLLDPDEALNEFTGSWKELRDKCTRHRLSVQLKASAHVVVPRPVDPEERLRNIAKRKRPWARKTEPAPPRRTTRKTRKEGTA